MKHPRTSFLLRTLVCAFTGLLTAAFAQAQTDDFNDGNDTGWTRLDLLAPFNGGQGAEFNFPNGGYQIVAYLSPNSAALGPGRAFSMRADAVYSDFFIAVDVVNFDHNLDQAFGIIARVTTPGLGTTDGYVLNYNPRQSQSSGQLQINVADGEAPDTIAATDVTLDSNKDYRFVFKGVGSELTGQVYELPNMTSPIISVTATDASFASGACGLFVYDRSDVSNANATFDNFLAAATEPVAQPPTLSGVQLSQGNLVFGFGAQAGFSYQVQKADALPVQANDWAAVQTFPAETTPGPRTVSVPATGAGGYLRVVTPAPTLSP